MKIFLIFGAILGGILGFVSSTIDIFVWYYMGHPPFLIRQGYEDTHLILIIISGIFAGLFYGLILSKLISKKALWEKSGLISILTILIAMFFYSICDIISIKILYLWPNSCAHIVVFFISLLIAYLLSNHSREKDKCRSSNISTTLNEES
jgi:hypothetical protein